MKAVTLRNLPPELARAILRTAQEQRTSVNKAVIGLLEERLGMRGMNQKEAVYNDLDDLAGSWTKEQAASFEKNLKMQRRIDPDLWK